tara:strand:- start:123 stop:779 length:657 start_codon:yes stop_codon:yes gene_type:complete
MARTADFRDINKNGIDDRDEGGEAQEGASTKPQESVEQTSKGLNMFGQMMEKFFGTSQSPDDNLGRDIKYGLMGDFIGKGFDSQLTKDMAEFQSGLYKDNALFGADLELRNQRDARADEFGYGMRAMDKQFELQDEYQNREFGRNIGYMQAGGEQTRKNYRAQGVEDRLSRITQGEQDRLNTAAVGDQARKNYEFEDRINSRTEARAQDRSNRLARGF